MDETFDSNLGLTIVGLGVEYPPFRVGPEAVETLARRYYPSSQAMEKVLSINRWTGIETRAAIGTIDHPIVNQDQPPSIKELNDTFMEHGISLSVAACRKAIFEWGGDVDEITHVVATTCTSTANPGFDYYVCKKLGLRTSVEKVLLHGIGCSGGLAAIRTACNLALGATCRKRPARVLVLACEICTILVRSELESINRDGKVNIGCCLFSDCASACIVSNDVGPPATSIYELLGWRHEVLPDSDKDLGFDIDPSGWKVVLSQRVPKLATAAIRPAFEALQKSMPSLQGRAAADCDWALHPGGATILSGAQEALELPDEALMAAFLVYSGCGNSSSATIMSVMDRLRKRAGGKEDVIGCAFGPGILVEMMLMRRRFFPTTEPAE